MTTEITQGTVLCVDSSLITQGTVPLCSGVFGQVFEGMDVVDAIANVKVGANDKHIENVVINGIDIEVL